MELIGENVVRFRAVKDGRADAEIHFTVNYRPTLANYSIAAWDLGGKLRSAAPALCAVDRPRVPLRRREVIDVFTEGEDQYIVMDTSGDRQDLVVLINESNTGTPIIGREYSAYAHVEGRYMYKASLLPAADDAVHGSAHGALTTPRGCAHRRRHGRAKNFPLAAPTRQENAVLCRI